MAERDTTGAVLVDPLGGLLLDPSNELRFKGPFRDYVTVSMSIKNPTERRIAFKIKTTAPKRYCVKPNSGILDPLQSMKVNVLLQPFEYDPNEKSKHKFMVQYLYLNDSESNLSVNDLLNIWKDLPANRLLDLKLKCIFDFNEGEQTQPTSEPELDKVAKQTQNSSAPSPQATNAAILTPTATPSSQVSSTSTSQSNQTNTPKTAVTTNKSDVQARTNDENTLNELKLARQENEFLKKEINRLKVILLLHFIYKNFFVSIISILFRDILKEEESRLKKLALQKPQASSGSASSLDKGSMDMSELLNNRLVIIIIVLIAIIFYLLLFR